VFVVKYLSRNSKNIDICTIITIICVNISIATKATINIVVLSIIEFKYDSTILQYEKDYEQQNQKNEIICSIVVSNSLSMALFEIAIVANVLRWLYLVLLFKHEESRNKQVTYFACGMLLSILILGVYINKMTVSCNNPDAIQIQQDANYLDVVFIVLINFFAEFAYFYSYMYFNKMYNDQITSVVNMNDSQYQFKLY
jgi:hypothetical protein